MSTKSKGVVFTGVLAAIATSSCCIPPVIAAIAGVGGASSSLSWMDPLRPYLVILAVVAIGYAWYSHLKAKKEDDCGCEIEKPRFFQTRAFLIGMTIFAVISISFPYYSHVFFSDNAKDVQLSENSKVEKIEISIKGMTCAACETHVDHAVNELEGIIKVKSSYDDAKTTIEFDTTQVSREEIKKAVNSTGYAVVTLKSI